MSKKQRATLIAALDALPPDAPRVLLATGKLVEEGFDHPPLDTLVLAMPVSWKGTLQQYAGRLHREHAREDHRYCRHRAPGLAANVGQTPAGLSRDGLSDGHRSRPEMIRIPRYPASARSSAHPFREHVFTPATTRHPLRWPFVWVCEG
jgi:superfamily II DNA or RNA helicase